MERREGHSPREGGPGRIAEKPPAPPGDPHQGSTLLGQIALQWKLVNPDQLEICLQDQKEARTRGKELLLGQLFMERGWLKLEDLTRLLKEQRVRLARTPGLTRYEIRGRLGEGATSVVYHAWDRELQRPVALKLFREEVSLDSVGRDRFQRELQAAAGFSHPNVVAVYDAGQARGRFFLAMELIRGRPLSELLKRRRFEEAESVVLIEKIARAVGAAHAKGIVHRDLKPANILVIPFGEPKVTDFGLARVVSSEKAITEAGAALGTPMYMAPEQVSAKPASPRTDVYALGAILYEMLTGAPPHVGQTDMEIYRKTLLEKTVWPSLINPRVTKALEAVVLRALEKPPERRHADAAALAEDLRLFLGSRKEGPL